MNTSNSIVLACSADNFYAMPLAVTVRSVLDNLNSQWDIHLFVLDGGIKTHNKNKIIKSLDSERVKISWIDLTSSKCFTSTSLDRLRKAAPLVKNPYPVSTYYRLLLPEILPPEIDKIIYIDTDIIVKADLSKLWGVSLDNCWLLGVQDPYQPYLSFAKYINCEQLNVSPDTKYFNAGVLVLNIKQWRQNDVTHSLICFIEEHPEAVVFADQDALNVVLEGKWGELEPSWNQTHILYQLKSWKDSPYSELEFKEALENPNIIHFTSRRKPWTLNCKHPAQTLFFQYLSKTSWANWKPSRFNQFVLLVRKMLRRLNREFKRLLPA